MTMTSTTSEIISELDETSTDRTKTKLVNQANVHERGGHKTLYHIEF